MTEPRDLSRLVQWFRSEWNTEMGSGRIHVRDTDVDPARVCLLCGREMEDRSCKLVCRCGYFASCSDLL